MNESIILATGLALGIIALMFILTLIALRAIRKKQDKAKYGSLPEGGSDGSSYGDMLAQKYKNERLEGKL